MAEKKPLFTLWYNNGSDPTGIDPYFDGEGNYDSLDAAINAALKGWCTDQRITKFGGDPYSPADVLIDFSAFGLDYIVRVAQAAENLIVAGGNIGDLRRIVREKYPPKGEK